MRAALIAPFGYEDTVLQSSIHLVLPLVETLSNDNYVRAYVTARAEGHYLIMDNGAAEGRLRPTEVLLSVVDTFEAHELVAPDVLGQSMVTKQLVYSFLRDLERHEDEFGPKPIKIQAVLQGFTRPERDELLQYYAAHSRITVLGIPKVTIRHNGDDVRRRIVEHINNEYPGRFEIHLLGASPYFPTELAKVDFPSWVRSTDSAMPYKLAAESLGLHDESKHAKRWEGYFETKKLINRELINQNIATYQYWAARHEG
jgi:hypothetical protein